MNQDSLARLRRLGVIKGARQLKPAPNKAPRLVNDDRLQGDARTPDEALSRMATSQLDGDPEPLERLLPGLSTVETAEGACAVVDYVYPLQSKHGAHTLGDVLTFPGACAARFCQDERLTETSFRDYLFLDTETTGLNGAGTLAFMVGTGFFDGDAFVVRQYFLRDPGDEPAMLLLLDELLQSFAGLVTFNGRSFDVPLLDGRYLMNRMRCALTERAHIDLLPPARRLWRQRFDSCALGSLESNLLGLKRTEEDVPGWLIPGLYYEYLQNGDGRNMARVFYHNRIDMLSMVTLAARVAKLFSAPQEADHPLELLALGKWKADLGYVEEAEAALRMAATPELDTDYFHEALLRLGALLKRAERREEAVTVWQQAAVTSFEDVNAHVELAKHYEWQTGELDQALFWTEQALALVGSGNEAKGAPIRAELVHRKERLRRKLGAPDTAVDG